MNIPLTEICVNSKKMERNGSFSEWREPEIMIIEMRD